ncbi:hypothetical protein PHSC3_000668 [Chlamydiales bacterium STE3]|nr:hypothetical protein PHSC3_000668 [Chlamydiales bacterium STE3]
MANFISSLVENIRGSIDSPYGETHQEAKIGLQTIGLTSTATLVTSVAFGVFGVALTIWGGLAAIVGLTIILVSLPLGYLSYSAYKLSDNMNDIIVNPKKYQGQNLLGANIDKEKIKKKLKKETVCLKANIDKERIKNKLKQETVCLNWVIDCVVEMITETDLKSSPTQTNMDFLSSAFLEDEERFLKNLAY